MAIQNLSTVATVTSADSIPIFSSALGNDARATMGALTTYLQGQLTEAGSAITQYSAPSAAGFNIPIGPLTIGGSVWLLLTPTGTLANGTLTLPAQASSMDGQELQVSSTQTITVLTVAGNGSTVNGAPTTIAANGFFKLRFDGVFKAWFRTG